MGRTSLYILSIALVAGAGLYQLQFGNNNSSITTSDGEKTERLRHKDINDVTPQSTATKNSNADYNPPFDPAHPSDPLYSKSGTRLITLNELQAHGVNGTLRPLWLAVAGRVYDVQKGAEHYYGEKGGYNFFTGRDGSRAFVTGEFNEEGLTDDLTGLNPLELTEIDNWVKLYDKDYTFVGKLIGRYYNREGKPNKAWYKYRKGLDQADQIKAEQKAQERKFPPCNSRFTPEEGGTVYCSTMSGGIQRDWVGVPRRYFAPGAKNWRCACVHESDLSNPQLKPYPDCKPDSDSCWINRKKLGLS